MIHFKHYANGGYLMLSKALFSASDCLVHGCFMNHESCHHGSIYRLWIHVLALSINPGGFAIGFVVHH